MEENGKLGGVINPMIESTRRVINDRRIRTLKDLGSKISNLKEIDQVWKKTFEVLDMNKKDFPFNILYQFNPQKNEYSLYHSTSNLHLPQVFHSISMNEKDVNYLPIIQSVNERKELLVNLQEYEAFKDLRIGEWNELAKMAVVLPVFEHEEYCIVFALNPLRPYDNDFKSFVNLMINQISSALSIAKSYSEEKKRAEKLDALDKAKTIFFNNISHEFRTPLTLILGPLEDTIQSPLLHQELQPKLKIIQRNSLRLLQLVNNLLDFSRIEAGKSTARFQPTDLSRYTAELASVFGSAIEKAHMKLFLEMDPLGEPVYIDKEMWEIIVFNLISNAFKYTMKGFIKVALKRENNCARLSVTDTGIGIPEPQIPHIFERFYRVESSEGRSFEGTGIGLSLIKELILLHGGKITVESKVNQGSTFYVHIPLGKNHLPKEKILEHEEMRTSLRKITYSEEASRWLPEKNFPLQEAEEIKFNQDLIKGLENSLVLVVDDIPDMRSYLKNILSPFRVVTAGNGEEALELIKKEKPKLILSDIMMPKMDGLALISNLKKNSDTSSIPIIFLSAKANEESRVEGLMLGANDYLIKPFSGKELIARVCTHLELGILRQNLEKRVEERTKELKLSEQRFKRLASLAPIGIIEADGEGNVTYFNEQCKHLTGVNPSNIKNCKWMKNQILPEDEEYIIHQWDKIMKGQTIGIECRFKNVNGFFWVYIQAVITLNQEREVESMVVALTDITERKKLEQDKMIALEKAEAEQRKRALEAEHNRHQQELFVDMICHEIRNPLNGIYHCTDTLRSNLKRRLSMVERFKTSEEEKKLISEIFKIDKECLESIFLCAKHQKVITEDVLDLSKLETKNFQLRISKFHLNEAIDDSIQMFEEEAKIKKIQIIKGEIEKVQVLGDKNRIIQVIINLLSNAIKSLEESLIKRIEIKPEIVEKHIESPSTFRITIIDTGIGLDQEEQKGVFDRFANFQPTLKPQTHYGFSGLGLFISKQLVELMGGTIQIQSKKHCGSQFSFTFQCKVVEEKTEMSPPNLVNSDKMINSCNLNQCKVLVVEDNKVNQMILKRQIESFGCSCTIAENGLIAVEKCKEEQFTIIFMDVEMPVMDGLKATELIRQRERELKIKPIPIVGLSGNARKELIEKAFQHGMSDYIVKPYKKEIIYSKIAKENGNS